MGPSVDNSSIVLPISKEGMRWHPQVISEGSKNPKENSSESGTKPSFGSLAWFQSNEWLGITPSHLTQRNSILWKQKFRECGPECCISAWKIPSTAAYQNRWAPGSSSGDGTMTKG